MPTGWLFLLPALLAHPALPRAEGPLTSGPDLLFCSFLGPYIWMGRKGGSRILSCEVERLTQGHAPGTGRLSSDRLPGPKCGHRASKSKVGKSPFQSQLPSHVLRSRGQRGTRALPESLRASGRVGAQAVVPSPSHGKPASRTSVTLGSIVAWANEGM